VDLSLHKLTMAPRKCLNRAMLFRWPDEQPRLLTDVNKA